MGDFWIQFCMVIGALVLLCLSIVVAAFVALRVIEAARRADIAVCELMFRRDKMVAACLDTTDYLVRRLHRLGHEPFESGAFPHRDRYIEQHKIARVPLPDCIKPTIPNKEPDDE